MTCGSDHQPRNNGRDLRACILLASVLLLLYLRMSLRTFSWRNAYKACVSSSIFFVRRNSNACCKGSSSVYFVTSSNEANPRQINYNVLKADGICLSLSLPLIKSQLSVYTSFHFGLPLPPRAGMTWQAVGCDGGRV